MVEGSKGGGPESSSGPGSKPGPSFESAGGRLRFTVELRPGETTIVSWKKLMREANSGKSNRSGQSAAGPSHGGQHQPLPQPPPLAAASSKQPMEAEPDDSQMQAGSNRLSTVIERIERMYAGNGSGDEEDVVLDNMPDDDEYDTEDSFIDDAELDDYFKVDNSAIKHDGFFVNRGKLERIEPTISTNQHPKKRRRKDLLKGHGGSDDGHNPNKIVKTGNKSRKASASIQTNSTSQLNRVAIPNIHCEDMQFQASPPNAPEVSLKNKTTDTQTEPSPSGVFNGDTIRQDMDTDQQRPGVLSSSKSKESELQEIKTQRSNDKSSHLSKSHSGKQLNNERSIQLNEKGGLVERFDLNVPASRDSLPTTTAAIMQRKEGSSARPKSTMLEKAIRDLEKIVSQSRPPSTEVQDPDNSSQAVKKRLPPEIKQKLAKVARLAQASYGKIPKDIINRLMSIVGNLMQIRTLKRNLKVMANLGLSAKQEKDDQIQKMKQELADMVKLRIPYMKSKVASSGDFQEASPEEKEVLKRKYSMDDALENKICDLYDLYVERLEEDSGPPVRKLYEELAIFWPSGFMDTDGIKRAIYRAKGRRGLCSLRKDRDKIKKKKAWAPKSDSTNNVTRASHANEKLPSDSREHRSNLTNKPVPSVAPHVPVALKNGPNMDKAKKEKVKVSSSSKLADVVIALNVLPKKKVKKKPNAEVSQVEDRPKHHKNVSVPLAKSKLEATVPEPEPEPLS